VTLAVTLAVAFGVRPVHNSPTVPSLSISAELAKTRFRSFNLKLKSSAAGASAAASIPGRSSAPKLGEAAAQHAALAPLPVPPALFHPASKGAADVADQHKQNKIYNDYIDGITKAIVQAFDLWRLQAFFKDISINGPVAVGGSLEGPALEAHILAFAPAQSPLHGSLSPAIAKGISAAWLTTQRSVSVPGLPWYPAFAAFPGPMAPPTPNIPSQFLMLTQDLSATTATALKQSMQNNLSGRTEFAAELLDSIATSFSLALTTWRASQLVMLVMGKGPVPTFAPPYVPVGPVVGGDNIAAPGHLMS
jgi:hypothetical protein